MQLAPIKTNNSQEAVAPHHPLKTLRILSYDSYCIHLGATPATCLCQNHAGASSPLL